MRPGLKTETVRRENALAVDWRDSSWIAPITVQAATPAVRRCVIKPLLPSPPFLHTVRHNLNTPNAMKTKLHSARRQPAGFTLVELLVVIAIIGILASMSLAVIPKVMNAARKNKAKLEAQGIVTAIQHYDATYGRFPVSTGVQTAAGTGDFTYGGSFFQSQFSTTNPNFFTNNSEVIAILMNITNYPSGVATANVNYQKNPQQTIFLSAKRTDDNTLPGVGTDLVYRDPWGNPYVITMDLNYDEQTEDAFYRLKTVSQQNGQSGYNGLVNSSDPAGNSDNFRFHGKVMVWSAGSDKKIDPTKPANDGVNKDNVLSW